MCQSLTSDLLKCAARPLRQSRRHRSSISERGRSGSCKYPVRGLTLIYSLPRLVGVHGVHIFIESEVMTPPVAAVFLLVLSLRRETNMHTVTNVWFQLLFYRFCKLLSSQASSSLVFGIKSFCVCVHLFFLPECFYWTTFSVCTYLYKIYIDALKSLKCLKCIIHTKTKKSAAHTFPLVCFCLFFFFFYSFVVFFRFLAFSFECCDEFKSSVKCHRIIFSAWTDLQSAVGEKRMCLY